MVCNRLLKWVALVWLALGGGSFGGSSPHDHRGSPAHRHNVQSREQLMRRAITIQRGTMAPPDFVPPAAPGLPPPLEPLGAAPSLPRLSYPHQTPTLPQGMTMTIERTFSGKDDGHPPQDSQPIVRPRQAVQQLATCWAPPVPERGDTVEVTLRFGFDRGGSVRWPPRITYVKPGQGASAEDVRESILSAFKACTPLHFSASMASSMPGYPLTVRFIGRRAE